MMKKWFIVTLIALSIIGVSAFSYAYYHYDRAQQVVAEMNTNFTFEEERPEVRPITEAFNVLLLGIGDRPGDPGRADSIIYVSVNPITESILAFNLPRDTYVPIAGTNRSDKLNHAYAYGRTEMTVHTVEEYLNMPIDYIIQVNMNGFRELVDAFGGVEVNNPFAFEQRDELSVATHYYEEGPIHLDGERALHYARMRKLDPRGDFGRNERQRQVIQAVISKASSMNTLRKVDELFTILGDNVEMNISFDTLKNMFLNYQQSWRHYPIETFEIEGEGKRIDGVYYHVVPDEERERVQQNIQAHLEGDTL